MRRLSEDDGAAAVLLALVATVLLGMGALVLDVGSWYAEGRQLQNGAEAAALAVAEGCVRDGICDADTAQTATAGTYAGLNDAVDGRSEVVSVCGTAPGLPLCVPPTQPSLYDCQPLDTSLDAPYVEVRTSTLTATGQERMPPLLLRALRPSDTGRAVDACARASYGAPAALTADLPLTISRCEYEKHVGGMPPDPAMLAPAAEAYPPWPAASYEKVLYFHDTTEATGSDCPSSSSGMDDPLSGGFGWLDSDSCQATSDTTGLFLADPGSAAPNDCAVSALRAMIGTPVDVPVFYDENGLTGANGGYYMGTFGSFVLTGFYLGGSYKERSAISGQFPCGQDPGTGSQRCISGFFVSNPSAGTGVVTGPSNGATVIQITG